MFEQAIQNSLNMAAKDRSFVDKLLAKEDVDRLRELTKKPKLCREDLLELLYLLTSTESKLLNLGEWDRYIMLKFFVWIREFIKIAELLYDYQDDLKRKEHLCANCKKYDDDIKNRCICFEFKPSAQLTPRCKQLLYNNERLIEHNAKFLIDLYLNIGRTTLSLGGTGLLEILKNKYELTYPNAPGSNTPQVENKTGGLIGKAKGLFGG